MPSGFGRYISSTERSHPGTHPPNSTIIDEAHRVVGANATNNGRLGAEPERFLQGTLSYEPNKRPYTRHEAGRSTTRVYAAPGGSWYRLLWPPPTPGTIT